MKLLETNYADPTNVSAATMQAVGRISPLEINGSNLAAFTVAVTRAHRMSQLANMDSLDLGILRCLIVLMPITWRQIWGREQNAPTAKLADFVTWLQKANAACMIHSTIEDRHAHEKSTLRDRDRKTEKSGGRKRSRSPQRRNRSPPRTSRSPYRNRDPSEPRYQRTNIDRRGQRYNNTYEQQSRRNQRAPEADRAPRGHQIQHQAASNTGAEVRHRLR